MFSNRINLVPLVSWWLNILFIVFIFSCSAAHALTYEDYPVVRLRSLDKITARTMTFEAKVGYTVRFGEIFIKVQACRKPPPVEKSESAAFLQIWQSNEAKNESKWIFSGWMFASSPALSGMDHPVYDVWVLDCLGRDPEPVPKAEEATGAPAPKTDGVVPNAVPPAVEPDKQKPVQAEDPDGVSREDDPGAFDDAPQNQTKEDVPISQDKTAPPAENYKPSPDAPETYRDETPVDDSSPRDDTTVAPSTPAETPRQEINGIY